MPFKLSTVGEAGLLRAYLRSIKASGIKKNSLVDIGDDAFVFSGPKGRELVVSTDALVERVHFDTRYMSWRQIGRKAVLVNLSDLAAMGDVRPEYIFVTCALPKTISYRGSTELFQGMLAVCKQYNAYIAGGDTVSSPQGVFISIMAIGSADKKNVLTRSGARVGDLIFSSAPLGLSALGLAILKNPGLSKRLTRRERRAAVNAHIDPKPAFSAARLISQQAHACMDSSDGLAVSVSEIARLSKTGAVVRLDEPAAVPIVRSLSEKLGLDPLPLCAAGGEDYTLIFTVPPESEPYIRKEMPSAVCVGEIVSKREGISFLYKNKRVGPYKSFEHFA